MEGMISKEFHKIRIRRVGFMALYRVPNGLSLSS